MKVNTFNSTADFLKSHIEELHSLAPSPESIREKLKPLQEEIALEKGTIDITESKTEGDKSGFSVDVSGFSDELKSKIQTILNS